MLPVQNTFARDCSANFIQSDSDYAQIVQSPGKIVPSPLHSVAFRDTVSVCSVVAGATSTLSASIKSSPQQKRQPDHALPTAHSRRGVGRRRLLAASSSGRQLTLDSLLCKERSSGEPYSINRDERAADDAGGSAAGPLAAGATVPVATGLAARCDSRPRAAPRPLPGTSLLHGSPAKKPALCPTPVYDGFQASSADVITARTSMPTSWIQVGGKRSVPLDHQRLPLMSCAAVATAISVTAAGAVSKQQFSSMGHGAAMPVSAKPSSVVTAVRLDYGIVENVALGGSHSSSRDGNCSGSNASIASCSSSHALSSISSTSNCGAGSSYSTVTTAAAVWQHCASAEAIPKASTFAPGTNVEEAIIISDDDEDSDLVEEVVVTETIDLNVPNSKQDCSESKIAHTADARWPDTEIACETRRTPVRMVEGDEMTDREPCSALDRSQTKMSAEQGDSSVREPRRQDEVATCPEVVELVKLEVTSFEELRIDDVHGRQPLLQPEAGCHLANAGVDENSEMEVCDGGHEMECRSLGIQEDDVNGGRRKRDDIEKGNDICVPLQDDSDDDLLIPVDLGTNSSLNKTEDRSPSGLLKDGEFLLNGQVCSFPKVYTIDKLCELHREREKAQQELALAQERITSSNFQTAFQAAVEKSDDVDTLTEEQQALADKMSLPAPVLRDRHPGCSFINARLQQHLFSESTCHLCFESVPSVEDEKLQHAKAVHNTPLGDYCYLRIVLANGGLHTLLMLVPDTSAALDYAFWLMSCHSNTRVVDGIKERILDLDQMSCRPPAAAADTAKKWYPSATLFIGVLSNYGLDPRLAFAQDESLSATFRALLKNAETVASAETDGAAGPLEPPNREANEPWPKSQNFEAVLAVVRHTAETRQVYTDNEIETMLLSVVILALDTRATEWSVDLEMSRFVAALLAALHVNSWQDKASVIAGRLATLLSRCHHHTCLHAMEFFTLNKSEAVPFFRHRLAYAILMQLLFGSVELEDLRHMKVSMLINIEKSILLPVGSTNVDLYLTSTLLRLLWHSVPLWALGKAELADLRLIYTSLKEKERKIRSSLRSIDIMEVKHLIFLMTCMWSGVLHNFENQEALFYNRDVCDYAKRAVAVEKVAAYDDREHSADNPVEDKN